MHSKNGEVVMAKTSVDESKKSTQKQPKMKKVELRMNLNGKNMLVWFLIALLFLPFFINLLSGGKLEKIALSQMIEEVKAGKVDKIIVTGSQLKVSYKDGSASKSVTKEDSISVADLLHNSGIDLASVNVDVEDQTNGRMWTDLLINGLPILLMVLFIFVIFRQARGTQDGIMGFGRSKAKLFSKGKQSVTFKDVGGVPEAKKELEEIVDFLKHPTKYTKLGARTPKGVLLVGPSGTGKTLLARAVAGEAGVPFFSMAGSEFMEMLVGVGASRVRDLFMTAKKSSPSIIFIDEIDAIGRMRGMGTAGGHDEREQTLNQILVEMDGFTQNDNVIVLAATNRGDLLDPALTRPGRFDRRVTLTLPDLEERKRILLIHATNKPIAKAVAWDMFAKRTVGFSGADLENMLNEAAIMTAREGRTELLSSDLEEAAMKVKLGPEKRRLQNDYERKMTAYHEAGHALCAHLLPHADPVHRVSIVSRGMALGYTLTPPEQDKYQQTQTELEEQIIVLLAGRMTELLVFKELTGGASSDIEKATQIARAMVVDYGMSSLGPIALGPQYDMSDWGRAVMEPARLSPDKQAEVDKEISVIVTKGNVAVSELLTKNRAKLDMIAEALLKSESLDADEFEKVVGIPKVKPTYA
jgi:cell division protease FtsH